MAFLVSCGLAWTLHVFCLRAIWRHCHDSREPNHHGVNIMQRTHAFRDRTICNNHSTARAWTVQPLPSLNLFLSLWTSLNLFHMILRPEVFTSWTTWRKLRGVGRKKTPRSFFSVQRLLAFARSFNTFRCMLQRTGKLTNWCIQIAAIGWAPQKWTGMGPVHSPAAVTIPLQKNSKQTNTKKTQTHKKQAPTTQRGKWTAVQFSDYRWERGDSIVSTQVLVWRN